MADKKFLLDVIKEVNGYSRDEDYPFWARKDYEDDILIVYPARLGSKGYANVELSDRHGVPGKLYVRGISYSESDWSSPKTPWDRYEDDYGFVSEKDFLKVLARLKKKADKQMTSTKIHTKRDPDADNGIIVYKGVKKLGEVWKGLDKKWHHSGKSAEYGGFRTKKEALEELLKPPSQRIMDYQPFDGYPRLASAKDLLREVRLIKKQALQLEMYGTSGRSNIQAVLEEAYGTSKVRMTRKDQDRVNVILDKTNPMKSAIGQLSRIKDPLKAYTRGLAFENENAHDIAKIYFDKATELWAAKHGVASQTRDNVPESLGLISDVQQRINNVRTNTLLELANSVEVLNSELAGRAPEIERKLNKYVAELRKLRLAINKTLSNI